jgi:hypothetical protein
MIQGITYAQSVFVSSSQQSNNTRQIVTTARPAQVSVFASNSQNQLQHGTTQGSTYSRSQQPNIIVNNSSNQNSGNNGNGYQNTNQYNQYRYNSYNRGVGYNNNGNYPQQNYNNQYGPVGYQQPLLQPCVEDVHPDYTDAYGYLWQWKIGAARNDGYGHLIYAYRYINMGSVSHCNGQVSGLSNYYNPNQ